MSPTPIPRVLIAAPSSGQGKTTVTMGLIGALRGQGREVAPFKVGPDYIDPGFHAVAAGRVCRNLDPHLCGEQRIVPLLRHGFHAPRPADLALIEGVMGLFDGRTCSNGLGSSAHVARLTGTPVVLVVDVSRASTTVAATVLGLTRFDPDVRVAGVILNRSYGGRTLTELRASIEGLGVPVLGSIPRATGVEVPSRHLGLVPAAELDSAQHMVAAAVDLVGAHVDLDLLREVAESAPPLGDTDWCPAAEVRPVSGTPVIAVATGRAFTFGYPEHAELLAAAGCRVVTFDPLSDPGLPAGTTGIYIGGGFPEVFTDRLSANARLRADVAAAVAAGVPTVAECAGLLYLSRSLDGAPMAGALPVDAVMSPRLTLGYHEVVATADSLVARAGERVHAHEFHHTRLLSAPNQPAWRVGERGDGFTRSTSGVPSLLASYQHVHWAGFPLFAQRLADAAAAFAASGRGWERTEPEPEPVLVAPGSGTAFLHHGDLDAVPGLIDLAVNVRREAPAWLVDRLVANPARWLHYPDDTPAREAIAAAHGVPLEAVLPSAGGMEAFTLIARALQPRSIVVHPQFSGPDEALRAVGAPVRHLILPAPFVLDHRAATRLASADTQAVFVGNPTNPSGVLHPASRLQVIRNPGAVLVVDEAFMDAVPGAGESLLAPGVDLTRTLVLRSITKTWGLAGIRAGYVVGDPELIARLRAQQAHWGVSTPALDAITACLSPEARADAADLARRTASDRSELVGLLEEAGLRVVPSQAPFVLVNTGVGIRDRLVTRGFAVRRGDTFPGLGDGWIRVAVRDPDTSKAFVSAIRDVLLSGRPPDPAPTGSTASTHGSSDHEETR
ncbi:cobyrinate a,c-diamide synthase [Aestuariimicrobium kwangyangense]|uniref:cobyrinate a,c-diamide synthase n=1 Tax=Aestuariimicrobium kwangyangense TaxID=396389 RepID=UPI0003B6B5A2|nr:cobyrinate a,c-diamide synthase [Aestuariimicrobium kwangyangense]